MGSTKHGQQLHFYCSRTSWTSYFRQREFGKHIDMKTEKTYKRINILRKFIFILNRKTIEKIYFIFVRPLLEYADVKVFNQKLAEQLLDALDSSHMITFTSKHSYLVSKTFRNNLEIYTNIAHAIVLLFLLSVHELHFVTTTPFPLPFDCGTT